MPSTNGGHYDHTLLASAPVATKRQIQEGYTTEILAPLRKPEPSPSAAATDPEFAVPRLSSRPPTATLDDADFYPLKKKPFWRTTKGVIILVLVAIAILGAIIGGAVGGTVGKHKDSESSEAQQNVDGDPVPSSNPLLEPTKQVPGSKTVDVPVATGLTPGDPGPQGPTSEQGGQDGPIRPVKSSAKGDVPINP